MTPLLVPRLACVTAQGYCAAAAVHLLRERERKYPAAVTARNMTPEQAAEGLELMRVIVAQWHWAIDKARPPAPLFSYETGRFGAPNRVLAAELKRVADRARELSDRDPARFEKREMADLCEALAWYQQGDCGDARIVWHNLDRGEAQPMAAAA